MVPTIRDNIHVLPQTKYQEPIRIKLALLIGLMTKKERKQSKDISKQNQSKHLSLRIYKQT